MKYIGKIFVGLIAVASLASCSSDFLETTPTASTGTATVFENTDNAKLAINGIALLMCTQHYAWSQGCCGENRIRSIYEEYMSQEFRYNRMAPGWSTIMNGTYFSRYTTSYAAYPWLYYYEIIADANTVIAHIDEATGTTEDKNFYKAQALTFRAYAYTQLLKYYAKSWKLSNNGAGNGVVLRLDESTDGMALSSQTACYKQIYADCDQAISLFAASGEDRSSDEVWLPNINVAYAVKARAALNREDYQVALENAQLARQGYALMSNDAYNSGFATPTSEWILGSYGGSDENNWYWTFGTQFGANGYYANNTSYGAGDIAKELTDQIPNNDIRKQRFLTEDQIPGFSTSDLNAYGLIAPGSNSWYMVYYGDETHQDVISQKAVSDLDYPYDAGYIFLNSQFKFMVTGTPGVSYLCWIRSSEMVLIEAEANYFLGNIPAAQASLEELNATRQPGYTCSKTGDALFQEIVNYRELELWGEGFNWYDHKRWNMPIVRKSFAEGGNCHTATAKTIECDAVHNYWTWDIPEVETDYNDMISNTPAE